MIAIVVMAMAADLVTFALAVPVVGIQNEMNPIMRAGYVQYGIAVVALLKVTCTIAIVAAAASVSRPRLRRFAAAFGASVGFLGVYGNLTALAGR